MHNEDFLINPFFIDPKTISQKFKDFILQIKKKESNDIYNWIETKPNNIKETENAWSLFNYLYFMKEAIQQATGWDNVAYKQERAHGIIHN